MCESLKAVPCTQNFSFGMRFSHSFRIHTSLHILVFALSLYIYLWEYCMMVRTVEPQANPDRIISIRWFVCTYLFLYSHLFFFILFVFPTHSPVFSLPLSCSYSLCLQFFVYANLMCLSFNTILSYRTQFYAKHTLSTSRLKTTKPKWNYA